MDLTRIQNTARKQPLIALTVCIILSLMAGGLGAIATTPNIPVWYAELTKPQFVPPNEVFGPVWTVLYVLMGIGLFLVLNAKHYRSLVQPALFWFGAQLLLNLLWSIVFFGFKAPLAGFIIIILLVASIIMTILSFQPVSRLASYLLYPYLAWVCFATYLTGGIWLLN